MMKSIKEFFFHNRSVSVDFRTILSVLLFYFLEISIRIDFGKKSWSLVQTSGFGIITNFSNYI
ncbi:hypothetical protein BpHYR1_013048 [Brachionus plicatilis]|uniref:Uncharacterized protein n=1 Tax=Brachionus plicatilis TaxID=10195 RepID=A0A3M7RZ63_BRAPC|nr:hypothetical protein BpHYR1_013048 [Brachionus plicatilis]